MFGNTTIRSTGCAGSLVGAKIASSGTSERRV
jgi:hypothetical protein